LTGRQVAVIGTGSTASQLVPPVAGQAQQLYVFQRTANWVMPRLDRPYNALDRLLAHFPPYAALVRKSWTQVLELGRRGFDEGTLARRSMLWTAAAHLKKQVPDEALRRKLTPPYPLGCKRIIYSNDFYAALVRPNVELVTDAIERITANGVVTADGRERSIDTLVCATGFDTVHLLSSVRVTGLGGRTLSDAWADGPEAYHGITVSGFPNMFLMLGPNTATGHTSTLLYIEPEVQHAITCMQAVRTGGHRWIDVRAEVLGAHNRALQARLGSSVWSQCRSWYRMESGRVIAIFPGFTNEYVLVRPLPGGDARPGRRAAAPHRRGLPVRQPGRIRRQGAGLSGAFRPRAGRGLAGSGLQPRPGDPLTGPADHGLSRCPGPPGRCALWRAQRGEPAGQGGGVAAPQCRAIRTRHGFTGRETGNLRLQRALSQRRMATDSYQY
jgi:hypothetical protein